MSFASSSVVAKTPEGGRFSPDILAQINELKRKEEATTALKEGFVTIEELGEVDEEQPSEGESEEDSDG